MSIRVALIQSEEERFLLPALDIAPWAEAQEQIVLSSFSERNIEQLTNFSTEFDCVIVGYNALSLSRPIRRTLFREWPDTNTLVLHQNRRDDFQEIEPLEVSPSVFRTRPERATVDGIEEEEEILLSWPERVSTSMSPGEFPCESHVGWQSANDGTWRTVLIADDGASPLSVLIRTSADATPRNVLCSLLLETRHPEHSRLLKNLVEFCAYGAPEVAVVHSKAERERALLLREALLMAGSHAAVEEVASSSEIDFSQWPLRAVDKVVVLGEDDLTEIENICGAPRWLENGGDLVVLSNGTARKSGLEATGEPAAFGNRIQIVHGEADPHALLRLWAMVFHATDEELWLERQEKARAVIQMLELSHSHTLIAKGTTLGLPAPGFYSNQIGGLLDRRLNGKPHVDDTISATIAALRLGEMVPESLDREYGDNIRSWLISKYDSVSVEDRLAIAEALGEEDLLIRARTTLGSPSTLVQLVRYLNACVACGVKPELDIETVQEMGLADSPSLAASLLGAVAKCSRKWPDVKVIPLESRLLAEALSTLRHEGTFLALLRKESPRTPDLDPQFCLEAEALLAFFGLVDIPSLKIADMSSNQSALVESLIRQEARARGAERQANSERERLEQSLRIARGPVSLLSVLLSAALATLAYLVSMELIGDKEFGFGMAVLAALIAFTVVGFLAAPRGLLIGPLSTIYVSLQASERLKGLVNFLEREGPATGKTRTIGSQDDKHAS